MTDKINKDDDSQESLVDALEAIKGLLAKSDSKLAAARESIAIASNQTAFGSQDMHDQSGQYEIPTLDDVVIPAEAATEEISNISELISEKLDETLAVVSEGIPTLSPDDVKPDPQVILDYLDQLQGNIEKALRDSLMKNIVTIEKGLKKTLASELDKIRKQIEKDFK